MTLRTPGSKELRRVYPRLMWLDGCFPIPTAPGLGVKLNEAFIADHPRKDVFFDLFQHDWQFRQATQKP